MAIPWLVLLVSLSTFYLGVFIWTVIQHFLTVEIPSALKHPVKFRLLHCLMLYIITLVSLLLGAVWFSVFISVVFPSIILP